MCLTLSKESDMNKMVRTCFSLLWSHNTCGKIIWKIPNLCALAVRPAFCMRLRFRNSPTVGNPSAIANLFLFWFLFVCLVSCRGETTPSAGKKNLCRVHFCPTKLRLPHSVFTFVLFVCLFYLELLIPHTSSALLLSMRMKLSD